MRRRRPAAAAPVLQRPAARVTRGGVPRADPVDVIAKYEGGEAIKSEDCPLSLLTAGAWIKLEQADYEGGKADLAGKVERIEVDGTTWEAVLKVTGTRSEDLLKVVTAADKPVIRAHLCRADCDRRRASPNLVHVRTIQKVSPEGPWSWERNCEEVDELAALRAAQEEWAERGEVKEKKAAKESSSSSGGKKKKSKKAKKKEKKKQKKEKRKKLGGRSNALKTTVMLYSGTGLDPDPENRRILLRKVKGRMKRNKRSSSSSSSTSESSASESEMEQNMMEERSKIRKLAEVGPGILSSEALRSMKEHVLTANGTPWGEDKTSLPPIVGQYARQHVVTRATAPMARELLTLAAAADMLLQARPAEACDIIFQRLKALEQMCSGQSWMVTQKLEIIPGPEPGITSRAELQHAQKERRLDEQTKSPGTMGEKGKSKSQGKGQKDRDKGKGKNKGAKEDGGAKK